MVLTTDPNYGLVEVKVLGKGSAFVKRGCKDFGYRAWGNPPMGFYGKEISKLWRSWYLDNVLIDDAYYGRVSTIGITDLEVLKTLLAAQLEVKKSVRKYARKALFSQAAKMLCRHGA